MTCDTWHMTHSHRWWWIWSQNFRFFPLTFWKWQFFEDIFTKDGWIPDAVNHEGFCRTALDTLGLESKSFEEVFFSPKLDLLLDIKWGKGGRGMTRFQKFWDTFCLNIGYIFEFRAFTKVTSRLSKMGRYKVTSRMSKMRGGVKAPFRQCPTERRFFLLLMQVLKVYQVLIWYIL